MPPPPVAGATAGTGLAAGSMCLMRMRRGRRRWRLRSGVGVDVDLDVGVPDSVGVGLALALAAAVAVLLAELEDVGEAVPPGENEGDGPAEGVDPEQAERIMEASNAMVLNPVMAHLALSPGLALAVRTFMEPPHVATRPLTALAEDTSPKRARAIKV